MCGQDGQGQNVKIDFLYHQIRLSSSQDLGLGPEK